MSTLSSPSPHIFEPDYYRRLYEIEEQHWWAVGMRDVMRGLLQAPLKGKTGLQVLDAGCGTGYLLEYLQRHYSLAGAPIGVDISPHALKFCRQRGASVLAQASAVQLPFPAACFDLVLCLDTLQHLSPAGADRLAIAEFARVLRAGGVLYLRTNSALGHASLHGVDPHRYRRYRLTTVTKMLTAAGLTVQRATYLNVLPSVWAMVREYLSGPSSHATAAGGPGLALRPYPRQWAWLNRILYGVLRVEAWLVGTLRLSLPFGHESAFVARKLT
jgi:ubiquinone/menaquinone biosynthesis C-methylase UbiE